MRKIILLLLLAPIMLYAQRSQTQIATAGPDATIQLQKFVEFYRYLNGTYVDTINNSKLVEDAIKKVLSELDPHSAYIPAEDMVQVKESFDGSFSGIGIEFNILNDTLFVVNTIVGGPSEKVGLLPNDRIISVNGEQIVGIKQNDVAKHLRGPKGTAVEINVVRRGENGPLDFRIVRDNIPINTVDAAYKLDNKTGYIKVNRFASTTMSEFEQAFNQMGKIEALVLDLRGNGGGLLDQAIEMSNFFLPEGAIIVSTEGRLTPISRFNATHNGKFLNGKLIVLIDESSASASEIVAGAVQDWDRGLVLGRRSFGKGLVQRQFPLVDGSVVRITVARYHTPTGRAIQRPFENGKSEDYYASLSGRFDNGYDSLKKVDSLSFKTLINGRTVYGGGGIYPDIYIPIDTSGYTPYWAKLVRRGVINEYVSKYLDTQRESMLDSYHTVEKYADQFTINTQMIDQLVALGEQRGVEPDSTALKISEQEIKLQLKALIAQKLWGMTEYYRIINSVRDDVIKKAMESLKYWDKNAKGIAN